MSTSSAVWTSICFSLQVVGCNELHALWNRPIAYLGYLYRNKIFVLFRHRYLAASHRKLQHPPNPKHPTSTTHIFIHHFLHPISQTLVLFPVFFPQIALSFQLILKDVHLEGMPNQIATVSLQHSYLLSYCIFFFSSHLLLSATKSVCAFTTFTNLFISSSHRISITVDCHLWFQWSLRNVFLNVFLELPLYKTSTL